MDRAVRWTSADGGLVSRETRESAADFIARIAIGVLFLLLSINLLQEFLRTGHLTGLLLLVSEALVAVMTILRRPAHTVDRSTRARVITGTALVGPPLLRTMDNGALFPDEITALVMAVGLCIVIAGKIALGRSFGIAPANRGVIATGPYLIVRHPIYAGYLLTHLAFLLAHPRMTNILLIAVADTALILRALIEERVLLADERYRTYCNKVSWHIVPGVF